ncbi:MAG: tetratricopeptide repeat protein [Candidatus Hodarchaeales archaeon]
MNDQRLKQIELLFSQSNFRAALKEIENLEKSNHLNDNEKMSLKLLKVKSYIHKGELKKGKQIAEELLEESSNTGNQEIDFDSLIELCKAKIMLGEIDEAYQLIRRCEKLMLILDKEDLLDTNPRKASLYYCKGLLKTTQGELEEAKSFLEKSLVLREKVGDKVGIVDTLFEFGYIDFIQRNSKQLFSKSQKILSLSKSINHHVGVAKSYFLSGFYYRINGELIQALEYFQKCLDIGDAIDDHLTRARALVNLGVNYGSRGETVLAVDYCTKSLNAYSEIGYQFRIANLYLILGNFYGYLGDLDKSKDFLCLSLTKYETLGNLRRVAVCLNNLGDLMGDKGDFDKAMGYFTRSLDLSRKLKFDFLIPDSLYQLIKYYHDIIPKEILQAYLEELEEIDGRYHNIPIINLRYQLAKAIMLKSHGRLIDKGIAQNIFQEIAEEEIIDLELTVEALINLFELLLFELESTENESVLEDLYKTSQKLVQIAKGQKAELYIVQAYLIMSKLKLLELNLEEAHKLLTQSLLLAKEKGHTRMEKVVSVEEEAFISQLTTWEKIVNQQPSIREILKLTQVGNLVSQLFHKRQFQKEEQVLAYAKNARELVMGWE